MRNMKTQERLTLLFTFYFFVFMVALGILFLSTFRFMYTNQLKQDLIHEFGEVTVDHIGIDKTGFFFKKDKNGDTLRTHLFDDGISALFLDAHHSLVRAYGMFEFKNVNEKDKEQIIAQIQNSVNKKEVLEIRGVWNKVEYIGLVSPLMYQKNIVGSIALTKTFERVNAATNTAVISLTLLGIMGILGIFVLIYVFTKRALQPLSDIRRAIEKTDLHKLHKRVQINGHPGDEFVLLATKFNEMLSRLEDMSIRQKEFIANASHELKTPLTRALSSIDIALVQRDIRKQELMLAKHDILEINNLIERLLLLGKVKEGTMPKSSSPFVPIIQNVVSKLQVEFANKHITIQFDPTVKLMLPIPIEYATILFSNIISNAMKYSPQNTTINIITRESPSGIREIVIQDNGIGIEAKDIPHIFERFYRGGKVRQEKGHGLGLSLVKQICDEYNISIQVTSHPGKGTIFCLSYVQ